MNNWIFLLLVETGSKRTSLLLLDSADSDLLLSEKQKESLLDAIFASFPPSYQLNNSFSNETFTNLSLKKHNQLQPNENTTTYLADMVTNSPYLLKRKKDASTNIDGLILSRIQNESSSSSNTNNEILSKSLDDNDHNSNNHSNSDSPRIKLNLVNQEIIACGVSNSLVNNDNQVSSAFNTNAATSSKSSFKGIIFLGLWFFLSLKILVYFYP